MNINDCSFKTCLYVDPPFSDIEGEIFNALNKKNVFKYLTAPETGYFGIDAYITVAELSTLIEELTAVYSLLNRTLVASAASQHFDVSSRVKVVQTVELLESINFKLKVANNCLMLEVDSSHEEALKELMYHTFYQKFSTYMGLFGTQSSTLRTAEIMDSLRDFINEGSEECNGRCEGCEDGCIYAAPATTIDETPSLQVFEKDLDIADSITPSTNCLKFIEFKGKKRIKHKLFTKLKKLIRDNVFFTLVHADKNLLTLQISEESTESRTHA